MTEQKKYREFWIDMTTVTSEGWEATSERYLESDIHVIEHAALKELEDEIEILKQIDGEALAGLNRKCKELDDKLKVAVEALENVESELFLKCQPDKGEIFSAIADEIILKALTKIKGEGDE